MKKTFAIVLALIMTLSCWTASIVSADDELVNLALNKPITGADPASVHCPTYCAGMNDGVVYGADGSSPDIGNNNWFAYYYNADSDTGLAYDDVNVIHVANDGGRWGTNMGSTVIDLEKECTVNTIRIHYMLADKWGILSPKFSAAYVSMDGETWTQVCATITEFPAANGEWVPYWATFTPDVPVAARYVKVETGLDGVFVFANEIEVLGKEGTANLPKPTQSVTASVANGSVKLPASLSALLDGNGENAVTFTNAGEAATVVLDASLGTIMNIGGVSVACQKNAGSNIALPTLKIEGSLDGVDYYDLNAGGLVAPKGDEADGITVLTANFSSRIVASVRYLRITASVESGSFAIAEISTLAAKAGCLGTVASQKFGYADHVSPDPGIGVFSMEDGVLDLSAKTIEKNGTTVNTYFNNSQLIKLSYEESTGAYRVVYSKVNPWPAGHTGTEELKRGELLLTVVTGGVMAGNFVKDPYSAAKWIARGLTEGDYVWVDTASKTVSFYPSTHEFPAVEASPLWVTHYNDARSEAAGSILTQPYTGAGWWAHFAFKPVAGTNAYELVAKSNGFSDGKATPLAIPEGGFVYAINRGNNYKDLYEETGNEGWADLPNYCNANCDATIALMQSWQVGDLFVFTGIDVVNGEIVPTTTPDKDWYDPEYVCTATIRRTMNGTSPMGDADGDGELGSSDATAMLQYLAGVSACSAPHALDLDGNNRTDIFDCVLLMRYLNGSISSFPA